MTRNERATYLYNVSKSLAKLKGLAEDINYDILPDNKKKDEYRYLLRIAISTIQAQLESEAQHPEAPRPRMR